MRSIKFVKAPGYIYDLFFLFTLYFNKDYCLANLINREKAAEDTEFYNSLLSNFTNIPNELLLFFYMNENNKSFMPQYYFDSYMNVFTESFSVSDIQEALTDCDQVKENVLKFYFKNINEDELKECKSSIVSVDKLIKNSNYNGDLKCSLYSFFISPMGTIQKLSYELMSKEFLLAQRYQNSFSAITSFQSDFVYDEFSNTLKGIASQIVNVDSFDYIYVSPCINHKNCISAYYQNDTAVVVLGIDYKNLFQYLVSRKKAPDLGVFGNAVSETNRVNILNMLLQRGEITIKDIEQAFGFSGTNAYYHMSLMIKAGMIKTRNKGRTVLYSLNRDYFDILRDMLSQYSNENERS